MKYQALRGTKDVIPKDTPIWQLIENAIHGIFQNYGFDEIRTPIIEQTELFTRSIGTTTDIVSKEMYTFVDKGDRSITLRPEATASVVRAAIENNLISKDRATKLYYIGSMFRYERPQAGRFRQFNQAGIEAFGSSAPETDAEVILAALKLFEAIGLKGLEVHLNSVGCSDCRPKYSENLKKYLESNESALCGDCKTRTQENTLRVLDCKEDSCKVIISKAPPLRDHLCENCRAHFDKLISLLASLNVKIIEDSNLVRGLDYYTKTTFEIISNDLGSQNAVCGGGRYDGLVKELGGSETPAVGMAVGIERLISVMETQKIVPEYKSDLKFYIAAIGDDAKNLSFKIIEQLRGAGIKAETDYSGRSLKSSLKQADNLGAKYALIIGEDEISKGVVLLRNMATKEQSEIKIDSILEDVSEGCCCGECGCGEDHK